MSSKIDGVPRELLAEIYNHHATTTSHCDQLRALLAAPVVERQPAMAWALLNGNGQVRDLTDRWDVAKHWDGLVQSLYDAPPELAELQAPTNGALIKDLTEVIAQQAAEIERLKGGQGEPVAWIAEACGPDGTAYRRTVSTTTITHRDAKYAWGERVVSQYEIKIRPLFTSQPAPVSVSVAPTDEQILEAMRSAIYAADGGYVFDYGKDYVIESGRALIEKFKELNS